MRCLSPNLVNINYYTPSALPLIHIGVLSLHTEFQQYLVVSCDHRSRCHYLANKTHTIALIAPSNVFCKMFTRSGAFNSHQSNSRRNSSAPLNIYLSWYFDTVAAASASWDALRCWFLCTKRACQLVCTFAHNTLGQQVQYYSLHQPARALNVAALFV